MIINNFLVICLSFSFYLPYFFKLRRKHASRIYAIDIFTAEIGGRLQPSWSEQLLAQLCSMLDFVHRLLWIQMRHCRSFEPKQLPNELDIPSWLGQELTRIANCCGLARHGFANELWTFNQSNKDCDYAKLKSKFPTPIISGHLVSIFDEVDRMAAERFWLESRQDDVRFNRLRQYLTKEVSNLQGKSLLVS